MIDSAAARAAHIFVRQVEQLLIVRVGMDRRHPALRDAERLVEHFRHRRQAVGRARRIRHDAVLRRIVLLVVDAHDQHGVRLLRRRRDHDAFRATRLHMFVGVVTMRKPPGRLEHQIHAQILPRERGRILEGEDLERVAIDGDGVAGGADVRLQVAHDRVVLEQVGERAGICQVIDRDDVDVVVVHDDAHDVAPDSAEAVDADLDRHEAAPS
jgi:hypothetical protein